MNYKKNLIYEIKRCDTAYRLLILKYFFVRLDLIELFFFPYISTNKMTLIYVYETFFITDFINLINIIAGAFNARKATLLLIIWNIIESFNEIVDVVSNESARQCRSSCWLF